LLLYTAVIVPVQICLWNYDDPCRAFPTLHFDVIVDSFFLVIQDTWFFLEPLLATYPSAATISNSSPIAQFEAMIQFLLGRYRVDMTYDDSLLSIAIHNLTSFSGFWCADSPGHGRDAQHRGRTT
jgi:hypothetical protein